MQIDFSNKNLYNEKYIKLINSKKRYNFLMWWSWSWKSVWESQNEIIKSFQTWNRCLCIRKTKESIKDSMFAELVWRIEEWNLWEFFEITKSPLYIKNKLSWSDFIFRWLDDVEKIKSVKWVNRIWIEEATEILKTDFDQLDLRLRGKNKNGFQIVCTFNPIDAEHWLNIDFWSKWENKDILLIHSTYLDNKWAWEEYHKVMERMKKDNPDFYKIYALWEWWILKGLIFENWKEVREVPKEAELLWYWMDFWFTNDPTTLVALYKYNWELYFDELLYQTNLTNSEIVNKCKNFWINKTIYADSSEPKSIEEIKRGWVKIEWAKKWPDSIRYWIDLLKWFKLNITSNSSNLLKEIRKYVWKEDRNGKSLNEPVWWFDHLLDAMRYVSVMTLTKNKLDIFIW